MTCKKQNKKFKEFYLEDVIKKFGKHGPTALGAGNLEIDIQEALFDIARSSNSDSDLNGLRIYEIQEIAHKVERVLKEKYLIINRKYDKFP